MRIENALSGISHLGMDTAPFIYHIEEHSLYSPVCRAVFRAVARKSVRVTTSITTLTETLILPLRNHRSDIVEDYRKILFSTEGVDTLPVSREIAEKAAELRAQYNLRTPDSFQIATALIAGCDAFLTNDAGFRRVAEMPVILFSELEA